MGLNMAQQAGGLNANQLFQMGQQQQAAQPAAPAPAANGWKCACGAMATGKFCPECGSPKPADPAKAPRFCPECGDPFDNGDII
jgi:membrane protease subunit (stomatin/prohibitin family)